MTRRCRCGVLASFGTSILLVTCHLSLVTSILPESDRSGSREGTDMLAPNTLLQNRYLIVRLLGQGGMGAVYQATDQRLGNTVALKQTFFTDEMMLKAFEREARLLASLRHPALPKVSDHFVLWATSQ